MKMLIINVKVPVSDKENAEFAEGIVEEALSEHYDIFDINCEQLELPENNKN
jgi:hypothetical protein